MRGRDRLRPALPVVVALVLINGLVLINAVRHHPFVGYDAADHFAYIETLADGRLPTPDDSGQFFAPPLPYLLPAALKAFVTDRPGVVAKAAQMQNVLWSLGLTLLLVRLCRLARPDDHALPFWTLVLLGSMPVYYKSFAFVRGEPLTAMLAVAAVERGAALLRAPGARTWSWCVWGAIIGLLLLSRQWGALIVAALFVIGVVLSAARAIDRAQLGRIAAALAVAAAVSGWFYLGLYSRYGSAAAFNQPPGERWSLANRPSAFYTHLGWPELVTAPVREAFSPGEGLPWLWPVFYSEIWGDYWCYWIVHGRDPASGAWASGEEVPKLDAIDPGLTNRAAMGGYLGRANVAGAVPTLLVIGGIIAALSTPRWGGRQGPAGWLADVSAVVVLTSAVGYFALLVRYPMLDVKATYMLHAAPFAAVLGAEALLAINRRHRAAALAMRGLLVVMAVHNAPLFISRFSW